MARVVRTAVCPGLPRRRCGCHLGHLGAGETRFRCIQRATRRGGYPKGTEASGSQELGGGGGREARLHPMGVEKVMVQDGHVGAVTAGSSLAPSRGTPPSSVTL